MKRIVAVFSMSFMSVLLQAFPVDAQILTGRLLGVVSDESGALLLAQPPPLSLRHRSVKRNPPSGVLGVARPDLLPVQPPPAGDGYGAGPERREVGAGFGLAEQLAPDLGRVEDRGSQRCFCASVPCASSVGPARLMPTRLTGCSARDRAYSML